MKSATARIFPFVIMVHSLYACTGIYVANKHEKLFGLNEDFYNSQTLFRILPAANGALGVVAFGHSNSIQAIINEKGLIYDGYGAPEKTMNNVNNLPVNDGRFIFEAMRSCETVAEVEALYRKSFHPWLTNGQAFFADRSGASIIIEGDSIIHKTGDYQICTNFYQSDPESGRAIGFYPCQRYEYVQKQMQQNDTCTIDFIRSLLEHTHVEQQPGPNGPISTLYSLIIDQNTHEIHVYNHADFKNELVLNWDEELKKPAQNMLLGELFGGRCL